MFGFYGSIVLKKQKMINDEPVCHIEIPEPDYPGSANAPPRRCKGWTILGAIWAVTVIVITWAINRGLDRLATDVPRSIAK